MGTKIIQDGTLTDIADAIRSKTGKSATMTPLEMPEEIESIETGGGGTSGGMKLLYETEPTTEQVSAIKVDFTSSMLGYDFYRIVLLGTFVKQPYPYVGINTETNTTYLNPLNNRHWECFVSKIENTYVTFFSARATVINGDLSYFHARSYVADGFFNAGFVVQIWGCNYENS